MPAVQAGLLSAHGRTSAPCSPIAMLPGNPPSTRLHANELPWRVTGDQFRRGTQSLPGTAAPGVGCGLARLYGVEPAQLLAGRGSDEAIDLLVRVFCRADADNVIVCPPTFGMYRRCRTHPGRRCRAGALAGAARLCPGRARDRLIAWMTTRNWCLSARPTIPPAMPCRARCCWTCADASRRAHCWWWTRPTSSSRPSPAWPASCRSCRTWRCCAPCPRRTGSPVHAAAPCLPRRRSSHWRAR